jgi:hypothetical protein
MHLTFSSLWQHLLDERGASWTLCRKKRMALPHLVAPVVSAVRSLRSPSQLQLAGLPLMEVMVMGACPQQPPHVCWLDGCDQQLIELAGEPVQASK